MALFGDDSDRSAPSGMTASYSTAWVWCQLFILLCTGFHRAASMAAWRAGEHAARRLTVPCGVLACRAEFFESAKLMAQREFEADPTNVQVSTPGVNGAVLLLVAWCGPASPLLRANTRVCASTTRRRSCGGLVRCWSWRTTSKATSPSK